MLEPVDLDNTLVTKVFGVGNGGNNAVDSMIRHNIKGVEFVAVDTDISRLSKSKAKTKMQIGNKLTKGLGTGGNSEIGERAAEEARKEIANALSGADIVFITAGMGGGTGTGAAPQIAKISKELGILTIGVVTRLFEFEDKKRIENAEKGILEFEKSVDSLMIITNQLILSLIGKEPALIELFRESDEIFGQTVQEILYFLSKSGIMSVDFEDFKAVMKDSGVAYIGIGLGTGKKRADVAAKMAMQSLFLENNRLDDVGGLIISARGDNDVGIVEVDDGVSFIRENIAIEAEIIFLLKYSEELSDEVVFTVIATRFGADKKLHPKNFYLMDNAELHKHIETDDDEKNKRIITIPDFMKNKNYFEL